MKRTRDDHQRDTENRDNDDPRNAGIGEREIDKVLADSFPASDAPSWTLGLEPASPKKPRQPKRHRA